MPTAAKPPAPVTATFADDGTIPNNPTLPLILYRGGIDLVGTPDPERVIEKTFAANGWGDMWRDGIFSYVHYHSMIHEALGVARGRARVQLGGHDGEMVEFSAGDIAVLPAGTGHQRLFGSEDLSVVGAYPPEGTYNLCRGDDPAERGKALTTIPQVPLPQSDPVFGKDGPLLTLWRRP